MEVAVPIAPVAATVIAAAEWSARSGDCRADHAADDGANRTAHRGAGHDAARRTDCLRGSSAGAQCQGGERDKYDLVHIGDLMLR
jgi:hypothetical protein